MCLANMSNKSDVDALALRGVEVPVRVQQVTDVRKRTPLPFLQGREALVLLHTASLPAAIIEPDTQPSQTSMKLCKQCYQLEAAAYNQSLQYASVQSKLQSFYILAHGGATVNKSKPLMCQQRPSPQDTLQRETQASETRRIAMMVLDTTAVILTLESKSSNSPVMLCCTL